MEKLGEHAVVLGTGIGGLLSARVLSGAFRRVTFVERDAPRGTWCAPTSRLWSAAWCPPGSISPTSRCG